MLTYCRKYNSFKCPPWFLVIRKLDKIILKILYLLARVALKREIILKIEP